jgi:hypothetical protein
MWSALIGGAFGLLGAAQQRRDDVHDNEVAYARQKADQASYFEDTRAAAERGGYNPLAALGMLPQVQAQKPAASTIGAAVSDAGLLMADALAKRPDAELQTEYLRLRNEQLTNTVRKLTLQPDVAGWLGGGDVQSGKNFDNSLGGTGIVRSASSTPASSDSAVTPPEKPLKFWGYDLNPKSGFSDAESWEDRYGDGFLSPSFFAGWAAYGTDSFLSAKEGAVKLWANRPQFSIPTSVPVFSPPPSPRPRPARVELRARNAWVFQ